MPGNILGINLTECYRFGDTSGKNNKRQKRGQQSSCLVFGRISALVFLQLSVVDGTLNDFLSNLAALPFRV